MLLLSPFLGDSWSPRSHHPRHNHFGGSARNDSNTVVLPLRNHTDFYFFTIFEIYHTSLFISFSYALCLNP
ncbi:MAG: hypothetical protein JXK95_12760 [Bacteroidales bacterium]|nr:hypothetical protein [Bacteroidales bacterium]